MYFSLKQSVIINLYIGFTKLLVALGSAKSGTTNSIEVIDLESPNKTYKNLPDFPLAVIGAFGGLGYEDNPIICGGSVTSTSYSNKCYSLNVSEWISSPNMMSAEAYAAVSVSPKLTTSNSNLFVTGGFNSSSPSNTVEILTPNGWETLPQFLPVSIYWHCSVLINSTTVMIIGGYQNGTYSNNTYYLNTERKVWSSGPALKTGRSQPSCGKIRKDNQSSEFSIIVAGGSFGGAWFSSVEILDKDSNGWREGPQLPIGINSSPMIEDPNGGVIIVGGYSLLEANVDSLYHLPHGGTDAVWTKLAQKLKIGRYWHVAFLVPEFMVDCS